MKISNDEQNSVEEYLVGYKKPPKHTQFKKGQTGNPRGRKKSRKSVAEEIEQILMQKISMKVGGAQKQVTLQHAMLMSLASDAAKGDLKKAGFLLDLRMSHNDTQSETIDVSLLSRDSKSIIDGFINQKNWGEEISHTNSEADDNE